VATPTRTHTVALDEGRVMTVDDTGDPHGVPVLYLHGTPDSRLARHPDDGLAAAAGVRLLAVDRPGYGGSSPLAPPWSPRWPDCLARDVARTLDALRVERCPVLAWSGGALAAVALAASSGTPPSPGSGPPSPGSVTTTPPVPATTTPPGSGTTTPPGSGTPRTAPDLAPAAGPAPLAGRVTAMGIVAGLVPRQAYDDPAVRVAGMNRLGVVEMADIVAPGELGPEVAPMLAPHPCDRALAAEHQAEHRSAADTAELATVPGGADRMAAALVEAVAGGLAGVAADVEAQARPIPVDLGAVACPVHLWYGSDDVVTPPAFGRWYETHLRHASLTVVAGAAHYLAFTRWAEMLSTLAIAA
jgi:pimeloyl-ACP methyl ester carboxylesterase